MALGKALYQGWQRIQETLVPNRQQRLPALLCKQYAEGMCDVAQLIQHAQRMHYPQFREQLLQLAREDAVQIQWLREQIFTLRGNLPTASCTSQIGKNSWECLRLALEEKNRSCATLLECIHQADRIDPAIAAGLRRWRAQAKEHYDEIMSMLMKSDPSALPPRLTPQQEQQRQEWLARQKSVWLDQERTRWEAGGKQTPWAEWVGEREFQWMTELPRRELEWDLYHNGTTQELRTATERTTVQAAEPDTRRIRASTLQAYQSV